MLPLTYPHVHDPDAKLVQGYAGMEKYGFKWESFKIHFESTHHKRCVKESLGGLHQPTLHSHIQKEKSEKFEQLRRVMNIIHLMVKKNHAANELEDHMKTHLANGCDVGFQYYNADSFNELCEHLEIAVNK